MTGSPAFSLLVAVDRSCLSGKRFGTCDEPGCAMHGLCHCGCGSVRPLAIQGRSEGVGRGPRTRGMPVMWAPGHAPGTVAAGHRNVGGYSGANDVPLAEVAGMVDALIAEYGSLRRAAAASGVVADTLWKIRHQRYKKVRRFTAERIERAFGQLDYSRVPVAPLEDWRSKRGIQVLALDDSLARSWYRALKQGWLFLHHADVICLAWGTDLAWVYPELYEDEETA